MVGETDRVEGRYSLWNERGICPGIDGRRRTIIKGNPVLIERSGEHRDAASVKFRWAMGGSARSDLLQTGHIRVPVDADGRLTRLSSSTTGSWVQLIARRDAAITCGKVTRGLLRHDSSGVARTR